MYKNDNYKKKKESFRESHNNPQQKKVKIYVFSSL